MSSSLAGRILVASTCLIQIAGATPPLPPEEKTISVDRMETIVAGTQKE